MSQLGLKYYVPEFEILFDGVKDSELREYVISFQITEQLQSAAEFTFVLSDEFNVKKQEFKWLDHAALKPGNSKVSLKIGYVNNLKEIITDGIIKTINTSGFSQNDAPTVTVVGYDATHDWLSKAPELKDDTTSLELKGSTVAEIITKGAKFELVKDDTTEYSTKITKSSETNYGAILKDRAESIGYEFFPSRNKFYFINPRKRKDPQHTYEWGKDLIQFVPSINTAEIVTGVKVRSMPNDSKNQIEGEATTGEEDTIQEGTKASELAVKMKKGLKEINDGNFSTPEEARAKAKAVLNIIGDNLITGSGSVVGTQNIEVGQIIELKKLGTQFSGLYFVTKVTHSITDAGYITQFDVKKNVIGV